jgi:hypothetical protein
MDTKFSLENVKGRENFWEVCFDGRKLLKYILKMEGVKMWTGSLLDPVAGRCEHSNEPSYCVQVVEFLDCLSDY